VRLASRRGRGDCPRRSTVRTDREPTSDRHRRHAAKRGAAGN